MLSYYKILEVDIDLIKIVGLCVFENSERLLWIEHIGVQRLNCGRRGVSTAHHSSLEVSPSSEFAPICPGFFAHLLLRLQAIILPSPWCDTCLAVGADWILLEYEVFQPKRIQFFQYWTLSMDTSNLAANFTRGERYQKPVQLSQVKSIIAQSFTVAMH